MSNLISGILSGYIQTQALYVTTKFGIPDLLNDGPKTLETLRKITGVSSDLLKRLLQTMISMGVFSKESEDTYSNNHHSLFLTEDHPETLKDLVLFCGREAYQSFAKFDRCLEEGKPAFPMAWGQSFWDHLAQFPDRARIFNNAMENQSESIMPKFVSKFNFAGSKTIMDVGGGKGHVLRTLLNAGLDFKGVVFDLERLEQETLEFFSQNDMSTCTFHGGDFFSDIPDIADLYILKFVLHDWPDSETKMILKNIHKAMRPGSQLVIIEMLPGEDSSPAGFLKDLLMLSTFGARERTRPEMEELLMSVDFKKPEIVQIEGPVHYICTSRGGI